MRKFLSHYWPLLFIIILGAIFRFTDLNWDAGERFHSDEKLIVEGVLHVRLFSQLFPGFHDYNGFSVYLLKIASQLASLITGSLYWSADPIGVTLVGRFVSAFLSTLNILLIFILGKKVEHSSVGLFAAFLFATTPLSIQLGHYYTTDTILIALLTFLAIASLSYGQTRSVVSLLGMSVASGLLLATKNTSYFFLPIPVSILGISFLKKQKKTRVLSALIAFLALLLTSFILTSPFTFLDFHGYLVRSKYLKDVVTGILPQDWTVQFIGTDWRFWLTNLLISTGPLSVIGLIGCVNFLLQKLTWTKRVTVGIFAVWTLGFSLFLAAVTFIKFIRYDAPLLPFLSIFGGLLLRKMYHSHIVKLSLFCFVVITQFFWSFMFFHIYLVPHTSILARQWIRQNVPAHAVILYESWNSLILCRPPVIIGRDLKFINVDFYEKPDSTDKMQRLTKAISYADYIVLESPVVQNTILRLSSLYPLTADFYRKLTNGLLGFAKVAEFSSYPSVGPFIINDSYAEETFYFPDHPTVTIYKKRSSFGLEHGKNK